MIDYEALDAYSEQMTTPPDAVLHHIYRQTNLTQIYPRMISGRIQGKFLEMICQMLQPKRALEIGTFTAYSTICIARGLPPNGKLIAIEANEEFEEIIIKNLKKAGVSSKVDLRIADAKQLIPTLESGFDLVFIDADKISYPLYFELVIEKVNSGGFILADNVLWGGKILQQQKIDRETQAILDFNQRVADDTRVEQVLLPIRDGLMLIRKK
ncbi:MAG: O-methyltransferase [Lentimicrobiaceae bacterium]|nr:O-methyltransferase [Lentimicrobiaceae bacterium]